ncbi:CMP-N-acetylneuraminate-beta-galactosamide-alpha-2,3-sialyltransferase 1-like [Pholidichthys leucotaenia]
MSRRNIVIFLLIATGFGIFLRTYHLSIHLLPLNPFRVAGGLIPASLGERQGAPWTDDQKFFACEDCSSEDENSRINTFSEPFLTANYTLSEEDFNWWKHLQNEKRSFSIYKTTVGMLFQMFPASSNVVKSTQKHFRTCAVVGNSYTLKGSRYGPLIDVNDVVIRINRALVKGYEDDVGSRTTHRVMYPESAGNLDNTTHLVFFPFKILDIEWVIKAFTTGFYGRSYAPVISKIKANKNLVMVVNPAFVRYVHERWLKKKGQYPSTGFMTLVLALHICKEVHVFGFRADSDGNWSHYWEELRNKRLKTGVHHGTYEYNVIRMLAEKQKIKLYERVKAF